MESLLNDHIPAPSEHIGDTLDENPNENTTRIYFHNLNGLSWTKDGGRWPYICDAMSAIQVDIACFSETNTDTNKHNIRMMMESICQRHFQHSRLVMSTSKFDTKTPYKPGGTAILSCNTITASIRTTTRDRMGRWSSISLTTNSTRRIRIISAYQVCEGLRIGSNTASSQQHAQLLEENASAQQYHRQTPRTAFINDLQAFIQQVQLTSEDIILVGDFNEDMTTTDSGIAKLAQNCALADVFSIRLGSSNFPATYQRGTRRLDFALISPSLLPYVQSAGYDPFGYRIPSDHRGFFIDFITDSLFRQELMPLAPMERRNFTSTNPELVVKYISAKTKYLTEHKFFDRLHALLHAGLPDHLAAEALDRDLSRAAAHAAKMCTRKQQTPWSPKLGRAWASLHFYRMAKSALNNTVNYQPAIQKLQQRWPELPTIIPTDASIIQSEYDKALSELKAIRRVAQEARDEFLLKKAALYASINDRDKNKALHCILKAESQHRVYTKIRNLRQLDSGSMGLNQLKIPKNISIADTDAIKLLPDSPDFWETVAIPEEIERLLLHRNMHHFSQAQGTPFTTPPLQLDVGYKADGLAADLILQGQIDYPTLPEATSLLIKHLHQRTSDTLDGKITKQQVLGKLRNWKESTTTSSSGIHLGHYHCLWRPTGLSPDTEEAAIVKAQQQSLLQATVDLLNYAISFGYAYKRWTKVTNIMLQKDPNNPRIHRLRVIHIYEADYNLLLAVKWRQAMHFSEERSLLNDGLYGSRPGRSAHDPALIEVLQNEMYRMSMKPGINFDLDATSCYDRILPNVAALSCRRMGMDKSVVFLNSVTLESARYHIKTQLGVSGRSYSHSIESPIYGTGQGSGNSPIIWCFVCSALFDAFASKAHGATFSNYDKSMSTSIYMIGFVDDCTQRVNLFNAERQPSPLSLLQTMEKDAQLWNDLLWASGGALEQSKCSFHIIQTQWTNDGHPFLQGGILGPTIQLHHQGQTTPTRQLSNYTSHKTLGCYINPAQLNTQAWKVITKKNEVFVQLLETNYFSRPEAWTYYTSFYLPSILYPLTITPLSRNQCEKMDQRFLRTLVPRCGYNRNMARVIRYAPRCIGGAGFKQLYLEQGTLLLRTMIKWLNSPTSTLGQMIIMAISWTQAFLGTSECFLTEVNQPLPPVGPSYLLDVRTFLRHIHGTLRIRAPILSKRLREHDRFLMEIALAQSQWTQRHLIQINSCRRYMQAQTLADICTASGNRFLAHVANGAALVTRQTIRISTFNQTRPGDGAWKTWRRFLRTLCYDSGILRQGLGPWTAAISDLRHWPQYAYDPGLDRLYSHVSGPEYKVHDRLSHGEFSIHTFHDISTTATGYPIAVRSINDRLVPQLNMLPKSLTSPCPPSLVRATLVENRWEHELIAQAQTLQPRDTIRRCLSEGQIISCSDGSATKVTATFGFVISSKTGQRLAKCAGPAPGSYPNSFRSEAYGVLATLRWLQVTMRQLDVEPYAPRLICHYLDNQSVITRIQQRLKFRHPFANTLLFPEQDVIEEIASTWYALPIHVQFKWVKGHQDQNTPAGRLPLEAQLNCEADKEASRVNRYDTTIHHLVTPLPNTPCQLIIRQKSVTSSIKRRVYQAATIPPLHQHLCTKYEWTQNTVNDIDWANLSAALSKYYDRWTTIVKHIHDISPTGHIAHRNNKHLPQACPSCDSPIEDNIHVIRCPHPHRAAWRAATIAKIRTYDAPKSDPYLIDILHDGLLRTHQGIDPPSPEAYPPKYRYLIQSQSAIGWDQLYKCRWSVHWSTLQDDYYSRNDQNTFLLPGSQWTLALSRALMDQWLLAWNNRNEARHGKDQAEQDAMRRQVITSQLNEIYAYKQQVCPAERKLFYDNPMVHLANHSLSAIEEWIAIYKTAILSSVKQASELGIQRNRTLLDYPTFNLISQPRQQASLSAGLGPG